MPSTVASSESRATTQDPSRVYEEGFAAGLIGAATIAVWFFALDIIQGRPLHTPTVLGMAVFHQAGLDRPESVPASLETAALFTWLHVLCFGIVGCSASWLLYRAERNPNLSFGILLLGVFVQFAFLAVGAMFARPLLSDLTLPAIVIGNLLAAGAMAWYFRRRHPGFRLSI